MFGLFKKELPHCDDLFVKYLTPWYPSEDRPKMTRPDMYIISGFDGTPLDFDDLQYLSEDSLSESKKQISIMTDAAFKDYQSIIKSDKLDFNVLDIGIAHF